mgnify:CR=1 FL=1
MSALEQASVTKPVQGTVSGWEMVQVLTSEKRQMVPSQLKRQTPTIPAYPVVPRRLRPPAGTECSRFHLILSDFSRLLLIRTGCSSFLLILSDCSRLLPIRTGCSSFLLILSGCPGFLPARSIRTGFLLVPLCLLPIPACRLPIPTCFLLPSLQREVPGPIREASPYIRPFLFPHQILPVPQPAAYRPKGSFLQIFRSSFLPLPFLCIQPADSGLCKHYVIFRQPVSCYHKPDPFL